MVRTDAGYAIDPVAHDWFILPANRGFAGYGLGRALCLLLDAMQGLSALHETNTASGEPFAHGELTPLQLRVDPSGVCRVVPLTTRHYISEDAPPAPAALGFLSPERLIGEKVGARADVFSAGVLLWEALAGRRLTDEQSAEAIIERLMSEELSVPDLPPQLAWATPLKAEVERALSINQQRRFADCAEFTAAILSISQSRVAKHAEVAAFFTAHFKPTSSAPPSSLPASHERPVVAPRHATLRMPSVPPLAPAQSSSRSTVSPPRSATLKMNVTLKMAPVSIPVPPPPSAPPPAPPASLAPAVQELAPASVAPVSIAPTASELAVASVAPASVAPAAPEPGQSVNSAGALDAALPLRKTTPPALPLSPKRVLSPPPTRASQPPPPLESSVPPPELPPVPPLPPTLPQPSSMRQSSPPPLSASSPASARQSSPPPLSSSNPPPLRPSNPPPLRPSTLSPLRSSAPPPLPAPATLPLERPPAEASPAPASSLAEAAAAKASPVKASPAKASPAKAAAAKASPAKAAPAKAAVAKASLRASTKTLAYGSPDAKAAAEAVASRDAAEAAHVAAVPSTSALARRRWLNWVLLLAALLAVSIAARMLARRSLAAHAALTPHAVVSSAGLAPSVRGDSVHEDERAHANAVALPDVAAIPPSVAHSAIQPTLAPAIRTAPSAAPQARRDYGI